MTRDEAIRVANEAVHQGGGFVNDHATALVFILEGLGVLKFDEPMPNPRRRAWEDIALSRAVDEAYIAAALEMRAGAITDALRMRGFKIVRA
jgi:hypothetical protein